MKRVIQSLVKKNEKLETNEDDELLYFDNDDEYEGELNFSNY